MDALLNLSSEGPFNVNLLDQVVDALYSNNNAVQHEEAKAILVRFQEHSDSWTKVPEILVTSNSIATKFLALQILDRLISTRWSVLPPDQKQGIRNFLVQTTVSVAGDEIVLRRDRAYVNKLNGTLVQVLKHEWPENWPSFIPELIESSRSNESLCENNMHILRLLSEDIYDFHLDRLTRAKAAKLKQQLEMEFATVFELCLGTLRDSTKPSLIRSTLEALARFLTWIPLNYVVETDIVECLLNKFMTSAEFRNTSIFCLSEIAKKPFNRDHDGKVVFILSSFIQRLSSVKPPNTDMATIYDNNDSGQELVFNITLFLAHFLSAHITTIESVSGQTITHALLDAHRYLLQVSIIDDRELFKMCVEYWQTFLTSLYEETLLLPVEAFTLDPEGDFDVSLFSSVPLRKDMYLSILSELRVIFIERMAKPNEVLVIENEDGELVREELKDNDTSALHQSMKQVLTYLTHLDKTNTTDVLKSKLSKQVDGTQWSWQNLNSLCWAIGSISGTMDETEERTFLHGVLRELLGLAERRRDKDDKVVIASNIMYVVGQYPRFLNRHWGFLKVVSVKLFEFMHESHEGVKDMACDTFMKIAQTCKRPFVTIQAKEKEPFMSEILRSLPTITKDLSPQQYNVVSQAGAHIISAETDATKQESMIEQLMGVSNQAWDMLMAQASQDLDVLDDDHNVKVFTNVLRSNTAACLALGQAFLSQLGHLFSDMLGLYRAVSITINEIISSSDMKSLQGIRDLKSVRKEILILMGAFVSRAEDLDIVLYRLTPPLLDAILDDYNASVAYAREAEVLRILDILVTKLETSVTPYIERIFATIFDPTLALITEDFIEFPEHRTNFFRLLRSTNKNCFPGLTGLPTQAFDLYMQSVFWAIKHPTGDISETGLRIALEIIVNFSEEKSTTFFEKYLVPIVQETLAVLTDSDHRSGLQLQALILTRVFHMVKSSIVTTFSVDSLRQTCNEMLRAAFPGVQSAYVETFTKALETQSHDMGALEGFVRDFLVEVREISA